MTAFYPPNTVCVSLHGPRNNQSGSFVPSELYDLNDWVGHHLVAVDPENIWDIDAVLSAIMGWEHLSRDAVNSGNCCNCDHQQSAETYLHRKGLVVNPPECRTADLVSRYLVLTKEVLPQMARTPDTKWPVRHDHCFQRIVLDSVCNGVWYEHLARPAYKHLSRDQAVRAVQLCEDIMANRADLHTLNRQSLIWRGK